MYNTLLVRAYPGTITAAITAPILAATTLPAATHYARDRLRSPRQVRRQESVQGPGSRLVGSGRDRDRESGP